ncbi:MAG: sensor histidine kinase, partial [Bacteroidetes bacterium]|nr:sensor histidine kinase [Bacteroidota bacterium]
DKALDCNFKALKFQKTIKNDFGITRCYIYLACIYKALHELQLSRVYLDSAIKFSKALGAKQLIRDSYELLSEVDSLANNWENAYNHYKIYVQYKDSIINKDNSEKMLQSQFQYELEKKNLAHQKLMALKAIEFEYQHKQALAKTEKEKQKLKYEQQIKEQKLSFEYSKLISKSEAEKKHQLAFNKAMANEIMLMNQNSYNEAIIRWLLLIALLAFVALGINYYKNYKKQKAANNIIAKQGEDLKALIHELNHRVKNNFQTVASMLRMQSRTKDDQTLVNILMQTSNQFLSIANAHQKLYLQESLGGIPVKDYLFDIVDTISPQYGITKEQFEFKITVACDLKININTMVPLVLIANELVTNSIKHAFNFNKILNISIDILHIQENKYQFIFRDNGPGFPQNVSQLNSFGLKLLKLLAEQLHGKIEFSNNNGAVVILDFEFE